MPHPQCSEVSRIPVFWKHFYLIKSELCRIQDFAHLQHNCWKWNQNFLIKSGFISSTNLIKCEMKNRFFAWLLGIFALSHVQSHNQSIFRYSANWVVNIKNSFFCKVLKLCISRILTKWYHRKLHFLRFQFISVYTVR